MSYAGLPSRRSSGWSVPAFLICLYTSLALSAFCSWSPCAHAEVRRYDWASVPTMSSPKEEIVQKIDHLCKTSKSDLGRYSDSAINRFIGELGKTDAVILNRHNLFGLKEMNSVRGRLIKCQRVFMEERHKRLLRADSGLEVDEKAAYAR